MTRQQLLLLNEDESPGTKNQMRSDLVKAIKIIITVHRLLFNLYCITMPLHVCQDPIRNLSSVRVVSLFLLIKNQRSKLDLPTNHLKHMLEMLL